jgi:hypothetical protein
VCTFMGENCWLLTCDEDYTANCCDMFCLYMDFLSVASGYDISLVTFSNF